MKPLNLITQTLLVIGGFLIYQTQQRPLGRAAILEGGS